VTTKMFTDSVINDINELHSQDDVTDDSCRLRFLEILPCTTETADHGRHTTECESGDWSAQVKQEVLQVVKQEPEDVCCIVCYMCA